MIRRRPGQGTIIPTQPGNTTMEVETQDFYLSAFLRLSGLEIIDLKNYGQRCLFVFNDDERFQELKKKYYWHEAHVDPMAYKQAIRELKGLTMNR